jgi:concentrative nucleoside transporter, CNT family
MDKWNVVSFAGIFILILVAWLFSTRRRVFNLRCVAWGTILQLLFGAFVFLTPGGSDVFLAVSNAVVKILGAASEGAKFCFGDLAIPPGQPGHMFFILAFQALPTIVFFAALMQILYYLGIMQRLIKGFAWVFTRLMGVSGAESLCTASNIFVGIESTATILPYLSRMTRSELCTILTAGLATIASTVLGAYTMMLVGHFPQIAGHLISASILSAPAALVMSKLLLPEQEQPETRGRVVDVHYVRESNIIEAAINGASAGGKLLLGVVVMLLGMIGLVALANMILGGIGGLAGKWFGVHVSLRLETLLGYLFYPFTLIIGVPPADVPEVSQLLGMRAIMTEIPAYLQLDQLIASGALQHGRSAVLASYALCGFAHIPSIAIFVGGISALAPNQTSTLSRVALRALAAATLACLMTAAVAGVFYGRGSLVLTTP